jgi:hypothetical protein
MLGFDWADGGGLTFFLGPQHVAHHSCEIPERLCQLQLSIGAIGFFTHPALTRESKDGSSEV